ncbi:hypothetical protein K9M74_03430 [Candidatus Woesearchaeota archaeon]|nr:hypothetical protein [Candidatus Woesearchaeota archaeon]
MATFLDLGLFQHFSGIFVFLVVFAVVYGFFLVTNILKDKAGSKGLYAIMALAFAFFAVVSKDTFTIITTMTPWFTVLVVFLFLIFFVVRMFTGEDDSFFSGLIKNSSVYWVLIVLFIIILVVSLSSTFGQRLLEGQPGTTPQDDYLAVQPYDNTTSVDVYDNPSFTDIQTGVTTNAGNPTAAASNDFGDNVLQTLVHPKVLGMIMLMLIGMFTVIMLAKTQLPE